MSYVTGTSSVGTTQLNPEYFRNSALNQGGLSRREFLERELVNLQASIYQYQLAVMDVAREGAALDGTNDVASWMTSIGSTVGAVTTGVPIVSIISWAVAGAGAIWNALEKKKDSKKARELQAKVQLLQLEAQQIQDMYNRYNSELQLIKLRPAIIGGAIALIARRR